MRQGSDLIPLAGVILQDSAIYRHCLVGPDGHPVAIVGYPAVRELIEKGLVPWNSTIDKRSVNLATLPKRDYLLDDEDGGGDSFEFESMKRFDIFDKNAWYTPRAGQRKSQEQAI